MEGQEASAAEARSVAGAAFDVFSPAVPRPAVAASTTGYGLAAPDSVGYCPAASDSVGYCPASSDSVGYCSAAEVKNLVDWLPTLTWKLVTCYPDEMCVCFF